MAGLLAACILVGAACGVLSTPPAEQTTSPGNVGVGSATTAGSSPDASPETIAVVGDSFGAGTGASGTSGGCARSEQGWLSLLTAATGRKALNLACGGARIRDVAAQAEQIPTNVTVVFVVVGGVDMGWPRVNAACRLVPPGNADECRSSVSTLAVHDQALAEDFSFLIRSLATPTRHVVVLGYPGPSLEGSLCSDYDLDLVGWLAEPIASWTSLLDGLVNRLQGEGLAVEFTTFPLGPGNDWCGPEPWLYGRDSALFFHLNDAGHRAAAAAFEEFVR